MSLITLIRAESQLNDQDRQFQVRVENIEIAKASRTAIVGPSGCGKTTVLRILALLHEIDSADTFMLSLRSESFINVLECTGVTGSAALRKLRAQHFGFIPADGGLFPPLSIRQNALLRAAIAGQDEKQTKINIDRLSDILELSSKLLDAPIGRLSRGQLVRGAILHGLVHSPTIVVADEPTSALHPALAKSVMATFVSEVSHSGGAIILSTHDVELAKNFDFTIIDGHCQNSHNFDRTVFI